MWDCSQAAIVSAWLQDVSAARDRRRTPTLRSPEPSRPRKRKAPSPERTLEREATVLRDATNTQMRGASMQKARRSRRLASGNVEPSTPSDGGASSSGLDEMESPPASPTPKRNPRTATQASRPANAGGQRSNALELPSRSLSFPQPASSASSSASAYTSAISHQPRQTTATAMTSAPSLPPSESGSRRSRSPVKGMASMGWAQRPVKIVGLKSNQIPDDIKTLCDSVHKIMMGSAVVPASMREQVDARMAAAQPYSMPLEDKNMDTSSSTRDSLSLAAELRSLSWVVRETERAIVENAPEAHWNTAVHWPLLSLAVERDMEDELDVDKDDCVTRVYNTTSATIAAACIPKHISEGIDLEARMVDFCMSIHGPAIERAARNAIRLQRWPSAAAGSSSAASSSAASSDAGDDVFSSPTKKHKKKPPPFPQSVNHTEYSAMSSAPISVSIETKRNDGSEDVAKAQLSVWVSAQILRLRQLVGSDEPLGITLPLVFVLGSTWQLLFAVEKEDRIEVIQSLSFRLDGASNTLLGCYKVVALLRALRTWSKTVFRDWFLGAFLPA